MNTNKEELLKELEDLYEDLKHLEKQYNDKRIKKESESFIWDDIKDTKRRIQEIEELLEQTNSKTR